MNSTELLILLRLVMAHLLGDFLLQPDSWVKAKNERKEKAPELYYHVAVITVLTYLFLGQWTNWAFPVVVGASHLLIDSWKSHRPKSFGYFIADQLLHLAVLLIIWALTCLPSVSLQQVNTTHAWLLVIAYYLVVGPLGTAIGQATSKWQAEAAMDKGGLNKAGMWIGRCERVLILTFIISGQYTALGFLMAAKSILRFGDSQGHEQKKTEYILVGTLISFASAALVGVIAHYLLQHY